MERLLQLPDPVAEALTQDQHFSLQQMMFNVYSKRVLRKQELQATREKLRKDGFSAAELERIQDELKVCGDIRGALKDEYVVAGLRKIFERLAVEKESTPVSFRDIIISIQACRHQIFLACNGVLLGDQSYSTMASLTHTIAETVEQSVQNDDIDQHLPAYDRRIIEQIEEEYCQMLTDIDSSSSMTHAEFLKTLPTTKQDKIKRNAKKEPRDSDDGYGAHPDEITRSYNTIRHLVSLYAIKILTRAFHRDSYPDNDDK